MNLFQMSKLPEAGMEVFETLFENENVTIERICSRSLRDGEWYDQERDEWVVLLRGDALVAFEDADISMRSGDTLFIRRHRKHRVLSTSEDALWLAVHTR